RGGSRARGRSAESRTRSRSRPARGPCVPLRATPGRSRRRPAPRSCAYPRPGLCPRGPGQKRTMERRRGWTRCGRKGRFRYYDGRGAEIRDETKLARIAKLVIPPAWTDVWVSPSSTAKLQATGVDKAGRRQYLYHADFRAAQEEAKYLKLIRFAERLPDLRAAMAEHIEAD